MGGTSDIGQVVGQMQLKGGLQDRNAQLLAQAQKAREADLATGRARGEAIFTPESLGRVDAGRAQEISDLLAKRQQALQGYSPEEQNAMRAQALGGVQKAQQQASRALLGQLGAAGLRGGARAGALGQLANQGLQQQANVEQGLFANQIAQRRQALDQYANQLGQARQEELGRQQFNIGQQNKELQGRLQTELGFGQLGLGERSAVGQQVAAEAAAKRSGEKK